MIYLVVIVISTVFYCNLYNQSTGTFIGKITVVYTIIVSMQSNPVFSSSPWFLSFGRVIAIINGTLGNPAMSGWVFFIQLKFYHFKVRCPSFMKVESL